MQLSNSHPLSRRWSGSAHHHRRPSWGHERLRPRPQTGRCHYPQCLLFSYPLGLQFPYTHFIVRSYPSSQRLQPRGAVSELGYRQLHHQGGFSWKVPFFLEQILDLPFCGFLLHFCCFICVVFLSSSFIMAFKHNADSSDDVIIMMFIQCV